jgi:hypothetical protein
MANEDVSTKLLVNHSRRFTDLASAKTYVKFVKRIPGWTVVVEKRQSDGEAPVYVVRATYHQGRK